jgi:hypothetical protein
MDILKIIKDKVKDKVNKLSVGNRYPGLLAVVQHIEVAEKRWESAKINGDDPMFTDVIYRTNHAFEGILKEAYSILEEKDGSRKTPSEIEEYLAKNNVFENRVLELFTNYRIQWRNPSTHDHKLEFTAQESFLAILSVSAFISILLDLLIEKVTYKNEVLEFQGREDEIRKFLKAIEHMPFDERMATLISEFSKTIQKSDNPIFELSEAEIFGMLRAFMSKFSPTTQVESQTIVSVDNHMLEPDFVFKDNGGQLVLEIKRFKAGRTNSLTISRMFNYLISANIKIGILYIVPRSNDSDLEHIEKMREVEGKEYKTIIIQAKPA